MKTKRRIAAQKKSPEYAYFLKHKVFNIHKLLKNPSKAIIKNLQAYEKQENAKFKIDRLALIKK